MNEIALVWWEQSWEDFEDCISAYDFFAGMGDDFEEITFQKNGGGDEKKIRQFSGLR